ncbi:archaellin/type IV pilin N-terminal domain-containing protein [Acidianus sp. HS-5]|uniref:archaellin/type IV pilin N-terminal domain-containing protein n=1 Tax=Acidianus sp. HS-5 TaxID=2886040 RepID=UPI0023EEA543|nr:archaellin/type IV pilin N-terminal domain-containing protein [Acidianus sp. HS-5]
MIRRYNKLVKRKGLAGLDTAIILIAFIITASVLAFVAINMGLFVTQKAKTTINKGDETASTALQLSSSILYATNFPKDSVSYWIYFTVSPSAGVSSVYLSPATTSISFLASASGISCSNIYAYTLLNCTSDHLYLCSQKAGSQTYYYYSSPYAALLALHYNTGCKYICIETTKPTNGQYFTFNYSGTQYYAYVKSSKPVAITFPVAGDPLVGSDVAPAGSTVGVIILFPQSTPVFQYQTITIQVIPNIGAPLTLCQYVYQPEANVSVIG